MALQTGTITSLGRKGFGFIDNYVHFYLNQINAVEIDGCLAPLPRGVAAGDNVDGYDATIQVGDTVRYTCSEIGSSATNVSLVHFTPICYKAEPLMTRFQKNMIGALLDMPFGEGGIPKGDLRKSLGALKHMHTTIGTPATALQADRYLRCVRKSYPQCAAMMDRQFQ